MSQSVIFSAAFFGMATFPALMLAAALSDVATLKIPNGMSVAVALAFLPAALLAGMSFAEIAGHVGVGLSVLIICLGCFAAGWIGGGDAKFLAASAIWFGWPDVVAFAVAFSIAGGVLALALLALRRWPMPPQLVRQEWIARLWAGKAGVPYAVAFAIGGLYVYPQSDIWTRLAGL